MYRSPVTCRVMGPSTSRAWMKEGVGFLTIISTTFTGPPTAGTLGRTPTLAPALPVRALEHPVTLPACLPGARAVSIGGTRAGVSRQHLTTWSTWSMPSTARAGSDAGDVYYIRSTDSGVTFSAPFKLNTDATTRPQWQPNISVSPNGSLFATWYDGREFAGCTYGNPSVSCYRMWSRKSTDNGATWLADNSLSDVASPLPAQPDSTVQSVYAGDYDYGTATASKHVTSWVDGRVTISGQSQQDAFADKEPVSGATPTPTPTATPTGIPCGDLVSFQVRCVAGPRGDKLQAKLTLTNTSHSGQQVTITVDGTPHSVTINGNKATLQINSTAGTHTVQLTNPAGCFPPSMPSCP